MNYKVENKFYDKIKQKVKDKIFVEGQKNKLRKYYFKNKTIKDFPMSERSPEICASLMDYGNCKFSDVPEASRTREFFLEEFTHDDVFDYIKNHIEQFDKQFFKDLIATNRYATIFNKNCFEIMPLEYINEEMCSLAILQSKDWADNAWFYSVVARKPEVLTEDLWCLGARLYARESNGENKFLSVTPDKYKTTEYYKEMCSCNYNADCALDTNKGKIMDTIPEEEVTIFFVLDLLKIDINSIARFNEKALEMEIPVLFGEVTEKEKVWQFVVRNAGRTIRNIELNDERVEFFLNHYDKDSSEYKWSFKDNYKRYLKAKRNADALKETEERTQINALETAQRVLANAFLNNLMGYNPTNAIEDEWIQIDTKMETSYLPIKYEGIIPNDLRKKLDDEEYLAMAYNQLGIQIIREYDNLFYEVDVPKGWTTETNGYWNYVKDENGEPIIDYFYDSKFYDRKAYVKNIYFPKLGLEEKNGNGRK